MHILPFSRTENKTIALVGAAGFIGSHLCDWILANTQWNILALDLEQRKIRTHLNNPRIAFIQGTYQRPETLEHIVQKADVVFNLASLCNPSQYNVIPLDVMESNYNIPMMLVNACAAAGVWLIHFSTSEVYGRTLGSHIQALGESSQNPQATLLTEDSPLIMGSIPNQRWCYAAAKQMLERWIFAHSQNGVLPFTIIRPFNFIGPRMDYIPGVDGNGTPRVIACFMEALLRNKPMNLVDGGENKRCFTWIGDVIQALISILENPQNSLNQIFNIGNPENELSIRELALKMHSHFSKLSKWNLNTPAMIQAITGTNFYGVGYEDSDRRLPDISKARSLLNWHPSTSIDEALHYTIKWFVEEYSEMAIHKSHSLN